MLETLALVSLLGYLMHSLDKTAIQLVKHLLCYQLSQLSEAGNYFSIITCWATEGNTGQGKRNGPNSDADVLSPTCFTILFMQLMPLHSFASISKNWNLGMHRGLLNRWQVKMQVAMLHFKINMYKTPDLQVKAYVPCLHLKRVGTFFLFTKF